MSFIVEGYEKEPRTVKVRHNDSSDSAVKMSTAFGDTGRKYEETIEGKQDLPLEKESGRFSSGNDSSEVHVAAESEQQTRQQHVQLTKKPTAETADQRKESVHTTNAADSASTQRNSSNTQSYGTPESSHHASGLEEPESLLDRMSDVAENFNLNDAKNIFVKVTKETFSIIKKVTAPMAESVRCTITVKRYEKKFKKAKTATAAGYRFKIGDDSIMITEYTGEDVILKMPNTVLHKPITYVQPGFLKLSGKGAQNIKQVKLPKYLEIIPDGLFLHCYNLETVVVPPTLEMISREAFKGANPKYIIFTGMCPLGLKQLRVPRGANIMCMKKYSHSFSDVPFIQIY